MVPVYFSIAQKYLASLNKKHSLSTMIKICFFSISLSVLALALSIFIMGGFEEATKSKLQNINPEIVMQPFGTYLNKEKIEPILVSEFNNEIQAFSSTTTQYGILQVEDNLDLTTVFMINAIDPTREHNVTGLEKFLVNKAQSLTNALIDNHVLIGTKLAQLHGLQPGDTAKLYVARQSKKKKLDFDSVDIIIGGLFNSGIEELDSNVIISSLVFIKQLFPDTGITQIGIKPKKGTDINKLVDKLKARFGVEVYTWHELYPALVSALKLEKYVIFVVLALILFIASMNLISLIFMLITQKRRDLAIFYAMGMNTKDLKKIFFVISFVITFIAAALGLLIALAIALYIKYNQFELPDVYYVSYLPIHIDFYYMGIILMLCLFMAACATWITTRNLKNINLAEILRFE